MTSHSVRRLLAAILATMVALGVAATPAFAHGRGSEVTNYDSRILDAPELEGVKWEVYGGDQYLAVTNTSDTELAVKGYQREPYLRISSAGVFENQASESAYVNDDRYGDIGQLPAGVGPDEEPRWTKISDEPTYAWHDHRIHWMSTAKPPVLVDESRETLINPWEVSFSYAGEDHVISGELRWLPPPSPVPWLLLGAVLTLPAVLGLFRSRGEDWLSVLVRPAAAVLFVVSLLNLTHLADDFFAVPVPLDGDLIVKGLTTALFIALGVFGSVIAWRGRDGAFTALGVGSAGILVGQGVLYLGALTSAGTVSLFPDWLSRLVVAMSLLQALWVLAVAVIGNRRLAEHEEAVANESAEVGA